MIPSKIFLTKGVGVHKDKLTSFELALRDAGIEKCNLVPVSSIFPPHAELIDKNEGLKLLNPGQITFCVMARNETDEEGRQTTSSIGLAIPQDRCTHGYLSEHHSFGESEEEVGKYAEKLAKDMLKTTLNVSDDSDKIKNTLSITQIAKGSKDLWTTVLAVAVFAELK